MTKGLLKAADSTIGALLCKLVGRLDIHLARGPRLQPVEPARDARLLVIRPGGLGDMLLLLPCLRALQERFPEAQIDIVCETRNVEVLELSGLAVNPLVYDRNPATFLLRLRRRRYQLAVDTEQFHNFSALFAWLSGAPVRVGFRIAPVRNSLYTHLVNYRLDGPEVDEFLRLLEPLGIPVTDRLPRLPCAEEQPPAAGSPAASFVAVHACSSSHHKLWPAERFVTLARHLWERHGLSTVLMGSPGDARSNERLRARIEAAGVNVRCATTRRLREAAEVMRQAALFVGTDSGLAHLAAALGLPTVVLFGPSDHIKWGRNDERHAVVRHALPCSPCFIFGYHKPCRPVVCMHSIDVRDVMQACERVLRGPAAG